MMLDIDECQVGPIDVRVHPPGDVASLLEELQNSVANA